MNSERDVLKTVKERNLSRPDTSSSEKATLAALHSRMKFGYAVDRAAVLAMIDLIEETVPALKNITAGGRYS